MNGMVEWLTELVPFIAALIILTAAFLPPFQGILVWLGINLAGLDTGYSLVIGAVCLILFTGIIACRQKLVRKIGWFLFVCSRTFFGTEEVTDTAKTAGVVVVANSLFRLYEWVMFSATIATVSTLKYFGVSETLIFLILWAINMCLGFSEVFLYNKTRVDFTLAAGYRRSVDSVIGLSIIVGIVLEIACAVKLLIWDGVSQLLIFMEKRIGSLIPRFIVFVTGSFAQMAFWTYLLSRGYDSLAPAVRDLWYVIF